MEKQSIWVVTYGMNEYNDSGNTFIIAYLTKPTLEQLTSLLLTIDRWYPPENLLKGGGRIKDEYMWYNLREEKDGVM